MGTRTGSASRATLDAVSTEVRFAASELLDGGMIGGVWQDYTWQVPGFEGRRSLEAALVGPSPALREWLGARQHKRFRAYAHKISVRKFEATVDIPVGDYTAADLGPVIRERVAAMLRTAQTHGLAQIIHNYAWPTNVANSPVCYDGTPLLGTAHPHVGSTAGVGSNTDNTAFSVTQLDAIDLIASQRRNESGALIGTQFDTIRCGQKIATQVREAVNADLRVVAVNNAGGESGTRVAAAAIDNVYQGTKKVVVDPFITTSAFYAHDTRVDPTQRPLWLAFSRDFDLQIQDTPASDAVFERDMVSVGIVVEFAMLPVGWHGVYGGANAIA